MKERIKNLLRAGQPCLYIVTHEEQRLEATIRECIHDLNQRPDVASSSTPYTISAWSCTEGLLNLRTGGHEKTLTDPFEVLDHFIKAKTRSIYVLRDYHPYVEDRNVNLWRRIKDAASIGKSDFKAIIIIGCRFCVPPELEKEITLVDFSLPDKDQLRVVLRNLTSGSTTALSPADETAICEAATGMTTTEAENAFAISIVEQQRVTREIVFREKCLAVKKSGMLEVVESNITLDSIGGLQRLKRWLLERKNAFGEAARKYKLKTPRGLLFVGQPGCGKSLTAKACRSVLGIPLLRLDAARLFGSLVGQSEGNWRAVHAIAKAMAPCILWIDEVDGAMAGHQSSGQTDSGVTARVVKSILQDMQDHSEGIFYVMTANDVDNLPSPLLRPGRLDKIWNVELPTQSERELIWQIQLRAVDRDPAKFDIPTLAQHSDGFSGAEIEAAVSEGMYAAFARSVEVTTEDVLAATRKLVPLSRTCAADIERRRKRLEGVAELAGGDEVVSTPSPTALAANNVRKIAFRKA